MLKIVENGVINSDINITVLDGDATRTGAK